MYGVLDHLKRLDWILFASTLLLTSIGILSIYSSSLTGGDFANVAKQSIFLLIGIISMIGVSFLDYRIFRNSSFLILSLYVLGVLALFGLLIFAPETRGIKGWYRIGDIAVDPIEYIKLVLIILMAKYLSSRHIEVYRIRHIAIAAFYFGIPALLIFLQPDFGSVLLLGFLWLILLIAAGAKIRHILAICLVGIIVFSIGWSFALHEYQKDRILSFVAPELDPLGIGWSRLQSSIAIGNGGVFGQGFGNGTQTQYGFLSEPQTDFIFSALAEEFGLAGAFIVLLLILVLIWRVIRIGVHAQHNFARLLSAGIAALLCVEVGINVGMNLGVMPIIGLPLPLVSYGGSSLIMTYIGLGLLQSIKSRQSQSV